MHKQYIEEIIKLGKQEGMEYLEYVFDETMEHLKKCDPEMYDKLEMKLYVAANGKKMNEEMATKIIQKMKPYGMKWTLEETSDILKEHRWDLSNVDFWIVMNSAYNDFRELFGEDVETYAQYSKLFIKDSDAKEGKVYTYFTEIPK